VILPQTRTGVEWDAGAQREPTSPYFDVAAEFKGFAAPADTSVRGWPAIVAE
jgi:hypothetical protein